MTSKKAEIKINGEIKINKSQIGFFRVRYEGGMLNKLMKSKLDFKEKLSDVQKLAKTLNLDPTDIVTANKLAKESVNLQNITEESRS